MEKQAKSISEMTGNADIHYCVYYKQNSDINMINITDAYTKRKTYPVKKNESENREEEEKEKKRYIFSSQVH